VRTSLLRLVARPALALLLALVVTTAGCTTPEAAPDSPPPSSAGASTPAPADAREAPPAPPPPVVTIDLADADEAAEVGAALEAAGYRVAADAPTAVGDTTPPPSDAVSVALRAFALVVQPRAPVLDVTAEEALTLLDTGSLEEHGIDDLVVTEDAWPWLTRTHPAANRFVRVASVDTVLDEVVSTPGLAALVPVEALDPRVRALTVDGHDPYRDPSAQGLFVAHRWATGPDAAAVVDAVVDALGWGGTLLRPVGFLATGELIPARCVQARASAHERGFDAIFDGTRDLISAAGLAMAHWEPAIVDEEPTPCVRTFNMSTLPESAHATARAGIDVVLAVGNHVGDCWTGCSYTRAALETVEHLRAAGVLVTGAGPDLETARQPVVTTVEGVTFAFLGYDDIAWAHYGALEDTPGTAHATPETLAEDVRAAKPLADHVIVGFSWGIEYVADPNRRQRDLAHAAIEAGASLVVGNHPHWVQATEWVEREDGGPDGFVAYSLGNFIFDQDWSVETTQGAVLEVGFTADRILGVRFRPTVIRQQLFVDLVEPGGAEGSAILDRIWRATDALAR
jgi:hypothetical protein